MGYNPLMTLGSGSKPQLCQPRDGEGKQLMHLQPLQNGCTHTAILFFVVNTAFNKLHEIVNTL